MKTTLFTFFSLVSAIAHAEAPPDTFRCFVQRGERLCQIDPREFLGYTCHDFLKFSDPSPLTSVELSARPVNDEGQTVFLARVDTPASVGGRNYLLSASARTSVDQGGANLGSYTFVRIQDQTTGITIDNSDGRPRSDASVKFSYTVPENAAQVREVQNDFYCMQQKLREHPESFH